MAVNLPDLDNSPGITPAGNKSGVPGGTVNPTTPIAVIATQSNSPQKALQTRWRPPSLLDFHRQMEISPREASRSLDFAIQQAFSNGSQLEAMLACRQVGQVTVTGSSKSIPTGLATVKQVTASIDNGATAHNFTLSATPSAQPGCIDLYVWQPASSAVNTPIACTSAVPVRWTATGTLS